MKITVGQLLLALIIIVALVVGTGVYAFNKLDVFKSPEDLFKKYLANNVEQLKEFNLKPYDEVFKKMENESSEVGIKVGFGEDQNNTDANLTIKSDLKNKRAQITLDASDDDGQLLKFNSIVSNEKFGIYMEELYDKYLALENRDLKKFAEMLELDEEYIDQIPDKIPEVEEFSKEDKEKLKNLYDKYINKIFEQINEEDYIEEKNVNIKVEGQDIKTNKYSLKLDQKRFFNIIITSTKEFLEDPEVEELYKDNKSILKENKEKIEDMEDSLEYFDEDVMIEISVYVSKGKTVMTQFKYDDKSFIEFTIQKNQNESIVKLCSYGEGDDEEDKEYFTISNKYENNAGELAIGNDNNKVILKSSENNGTTSVKVELKAEDLEDNGFNISFNFKVDSSITVEELTDENSLILNDYTKEEFEELVQKITENITKSIEDNPNSIFANMFNFGGMSDYYDINNNYDFNNSDFNFDNEFNFDDDYNSYNNDFNFDDDFNLDDEFNFDDNDYDFDNN